MAEQKQQQSKAPTQAQIKEWKKKYGQVYKLASGDKVAYIRDPKSSVKVMKHLLSELEKSSVHFIEALMKDCFLGGDTALRDEGPYVNDLVENEEVFRLAQPIEPEVREENGQYVIKAGEYEVKVQPVARDHLRQAEQKNTKGQPFDTNIFLSEMLATEGLEAVKQDTPAYIAFLNGMNEVREKKPVSLQPV